jgi:integrase
VVLSAEEVTRILEVAPGPGLKYRAAFSVAYGGGLRASEVTHPRVPDIDSDPLSGHCCAMPCRAAGC